jgi:hypothetical protein
MQDSHLLWYTFETIKKICLNKIFSKVDVKNMSDAFPVQNFLKK